jgi:hypothetical protein
MLPSIMSLEAAQQRHGNAGRNDACPCGSGKKYKKCHLPEDDAAIRAELQRLEAEAVAKAAQLAAEEAEQEAAEGTPAGAGKKASAATKGKKRDAGGATPGPRQGPNARAKNLPRRGAV